MYIDCSNNHDFGHSFPSRFLHEVADNSDKNKMNAANLATVFGPNLMRPEVNRHHTTTYKYMNIL